MDFKIKSSARMVAEEFDALPSKCKEMFFDLLMKNSSCEANEGKDIFWIFDVCGFGYSKCKSPIETIFQFAFNTYSIIEGNYIELIPQLEINVSGKRYYADFCSETDVPVIIECDGHKYHSLKSQIKHDNEKDYDLKMMNYHVLHFSGSQIYNDPWECAKMAYDYIVKVNGEDNGKC